MGCSTKIYTQYIYNNNSILIKKEFQNSIRLEELATLEEKVEKESCCELISKQRLEEVKEEGEEKGAVFSCFQIEDVEEESSWRVCSRQAVEDTHFPLQYFRNTLIQKVVNYNGIIKSKEKDKGEEKKKGEGEEKEKEKKKEKEKEKGFKLNK